VSDRPDITEWTVCLGSGGRAFLTVPVGQGQVYCYAEAAATAPAEPAGDWREAFRGFRSEVWDLLAQAEDVHFAALHEVTGSDWVRDRTVLVGDAAHACSPSMAQGGAMALENSVVLAELLAALPVHLALSLYQTRRRERITWVREQNRRRDRAPSLPGPVRDTVLRLGRAAGEKEPRASGSPALT
jgi:2-polyprenyl-6-methoxyphenol hydroxylase-like FAD-dependent oxidoreductase